jgi:hypothetical protein
MLNKIFKLRLLLINKFAEKMLVKHLLNNISNYVLLFVPCFVSCVLTFYYAGGGARTVEMP